LSGGKKITGFSKSGNIYSASILKGFPNGNIAVPTGILINGKWEDIARSTERFVIGSNSDTRLTDNSQNWTANELVGSYILVQPVKWHWSPGYITSNTSNTVYFNPINHTIVGDTYVAYYIANHDRYLQSPGDWTFKNRTLKVYYDTDLNNESVEFAYSDSIISLQNCTYINFQDIIFELANYRLLSAYNCNQIKITNCEFRYTAGEGVMFSDVDNISFINNYIHDCGAVGLRLYLFGPTEIKNNLFRRITTQQVGMANYDFRMGAAITIHYPVDADPEIMYNYFDSVGLAIQGHTFSISRSAIISCNYIENYGVTISDCGAIYFSSDLSSATYKKIKKNIIRDAVTAGNRYLPYGDDAINPHPVLHPHAIYLDAEALGYLCDSNSIENTSIAFYSNRNYKNAFKNITWSMPINLFLQPIALFILKIRPSDGQMHLQTEIQFGQIILCLSGTSTAGVYLRHTSMTVNSLGVDNNTFYFDYNRIAHPLTAHPLSENMFCIMV
jgi:hypothetical protein